MSRTIRAPYITDGEGTKSRRDEKRIANHTVRHSGTLASGKAYRKVYESWDIRDYSFYAPERARGTKLRIRQTPSLQALTVPEPAAYGPYSCTDDERWLELNPEYIGARAVRAMEDEVPAGWEDYEVEEEIFQEMMSREYHDGDIEDETSDEEAEMSSMYPSYPEAFNWYHAETVQEDAVYYDHYDHDASQYIMEEDCVYMEEDCVYGFYAERIETIRIRHGAYTEI